MASNLGDAGAVRTTLARKEALGDTLFPRSPVGMHTEPLRKLAAPKNGSGSNVCFMRKYRPCFKPVDTTFSI